jgi:hypothetical protein
MKILSFFGKLFTSLNSNKIIILLILFVILILYWTRFQIVETHDKETAGFYKIDRWTGEIIFVRGKKMYDVTY